MNVCQRINITMVKTSFFTVFSSPVYGVLAVIIPVRGIFTDTTSVKFGGVPAGSFIIVSSTGIDAVAGSGASGDITVNTPLGIASMQGFNFNTQPACFFFAEDQQLQIKRLREDSWLKKR